MKTVLLILIILLTLFFASFIILGFISRSGKPVGLIQGKLSKCPDKPNCFCSEYKNSKSHYIDPVSVPEGITSETISIIKSALTESGGTIVTENSDYIAAVFSSKLFGFIDDLEIRFDYGKNIIHMRSASRVGYGDMGINRKRIDLIKNLFYKDMK